jgi:hypothetical protein
MLISGFVSIGVLKRVCPACGQAGAPGRHELHQAPGVGRRSNLRIERGLLRDQSGNHVRSRPLEVEYLRVQSQYVSGKMT